MSSCCADGCGEAESLFLDVSALVPEADFGAAADGETFCGGLLTALSGSSSGDRFTPVGDRASGRAGGPPRRAAAMNRRPATAVLAADDAAAAARRAGRRAGEYAHITQDMLKDGGFFDMPIQVRQSSHPNQKLRRLGTPRRRPVGC